MSINYEIVKYAPEFRSQVIELQKHLWGPDLAVNSAYLEWKHERNPYLETPLIYLALYQGQVVGMRGIYGAKWRVGQPCQSFLGPCAGDLVIAPNHRNRRLFTQIMRVALNDLAKRGYTYLFNLSASRVTYLGSLAMGWRSPGSLRIMYRRTRHISPQVGSYTSSQPFLVPNDSSHSRVSLEQTARPQAMAELIDRISSDGRICHVRDQQYFSWRFQNPRSRYWFLFWEDARLEGYLVLQSRIYGDSESVSIVDWEGNDPSVRADLLETALQWGKFQTWNIWSATLPDETKRLLQNNGFQPVADTEGIARHLPGILVRPVQDGMLDADWLLANRRLLDLANWDLRMIYSDNY